MTDEEFTATAPAGATDTATAKPIVVMKFGGTSVAEKTGRDNIARRVLAALELGKAPVLVVSAMGRRGAPYATDTLLDLVAEHPADERERDLLASVGEIVSAVVIAHELRTAGIDALAFSGAEAGISTDGVQGNAAITEIRPGALLQAIREGKVPVVAGFQGLAEDGHLTTLGRGGSDTTACALGVALTAEEVEIFTDVDGVMTADPRTCDGTEVVEVIRADELFQMARAGSRVVHTPAAELALNSGIAVRVKNTFSDHEGTLVADIASYRPDRVATAVSAATGVVRMRVTLRAPEGTREHMATQSRIYRAMAEAGVSLDMFTPAGDTLIFTVSDQLMRAACEVLDKLELPYDARSGLSKVTLVGAGMHGVPGVMARMAAYLENAGVDVFQTADSHTTISVLVPAEQTHAAVRALHDGFELTGDPAAPVPAPGGKVRTGLTQPFPMVTPAAVAPTAGGAAPALSAAAIAAARGAALSAHANGGVSPLVGGSGIASEPGSDPDSAAELSRERFGARADGYRASTVHASGPDLERLIALVDPHEGERALDVATGAGHTALALAKSGAVVVATDITPEMLEEASSALREAGHEVETTHADAHELPFDDASFEIVTARMAPHHFADPARFVAEVARVLAPGGRFGLEDQVAPADESGAAVINRFEQLRDPSHRRQLPVSEWERLATEAGLEVVSTELFGKDLEFAWWTSVQNVSFEDRQRLSMLLVEAPRTAREWYVPVFSETGLITQFRSPHLVMLARKPEAVLVTGEQDAEAGPAGAE